MRSTSWRGGEGEPNSSGGGFGVDSGGPPRLERSKSTQGNLANREYPADSVHPGVHRRLANAPWDEEIPEW